jgi:hypothetical protein
MFTTLEVAKAAESTGLTTLAKLKDDLKISSGKDDDYLKGQIAEVSGHVCAYLKVPQADDGSRTLGLEQLIETFRYSGGSHGFRGRLFHHEDEPRHSRLLLARKPVTAIASVVENGVTLDPEQYQVIGRSGILVRLRNDRQSSWHTSGKLVVTFSAGWILPGQQGRTLPAEIEGAVVDLIKMARSARTRDPTVKSENVHGVDSVEYWVGGIGEGELPETIASKLERYKYRVLG